MKMKSLILTLVISGVVGAQENTNTSTQTVKMNSEASTKSSFGVIFYTLGGVDDTQLKDKDPSYSIYDAYVGFSWKVSENIRLGVLPTFGYTTAGYDFKGSQVTDKFYWRDSSITISQNQVLEDILPASIDLKQKARLYLPTSDGSKDEGMIARLRLEVEGRYNFDRYSSVRYYAKPSYYFQRTTAFLSSSNNKIRTTKKADIQHGPEVNYSLNKTFSLKPGFEIEDTWSNESDVNFREASRNSEISWRFGIEVRPTRDMNFTLGIQDKRNLIDPNGTTPVTSYSLLTNMVLF